MISNTVNLWETLWYLTKIKEFLKTEKDILQMVAKAKGAK